MEFRVVELAKQDNNVTTIEFVTETLEKLYLTGFNEEETQVWFAAIKGVLNEWRQYASKYGSVSFLLHLLHVYNEQLNLLSKSYFIDNTNVFK